MAWAYIKSYYRKECKFSFDDLPKMIDKILTESLTVKYVRRYARHCYRFMDGYKLKMQGPLLDFAMKKHSKHRSFPDDVTVEAIAAAYEKLKEEQKNSKAKL
jgi:hypothetical protein